jgi:hypothetical protein
MVSAVFLARLVAARADRMVLVTSAVDLPLPLLRYLATVNPAAILQPRVAAVCVGPQDQWLAQDCRSYVSSVVSPTSS